ncbi:pyridoxal phosphate-dependent aminotransferase [Nannocystis radixulma]|uniref:Aminotransferase n=1 Tax=Nannocystis radixulma TaxID=2995305 RepID=A0ABT5BEN6_9BACT|nr:pyridoxal phosphate-dependent aminotransferase [Nannocystis radixulma]MDC0671969.1 pyridoxal phosphate-dependent aminotransferase [Nannocystis radixulma]
MTACQKRGGIDLATGIPSTSADPRAVDGAVAALRAGANVYSDTRGLPELRRAVAGKLRRENALDYDAEREVLITSGITGGLAASLLALFKAGDTVLVLEPFFDWHIRLIVLAGLTPGFVSLRGPDYALTRASLEAALGPRVRGLVLCTPGNPSGKVLARDELETIADFAREHDLRLVTDEQYESFCFGDARHLSPAAVGDLRRRTATVGGFSKSLAVTGWRIGYAAGPARFIDAIHDVHQALYICPPTPLQHGVLAALTGSSDGPDVHAFERKRDRLCAALRDAGFGVCVPQGGFFVLADSRTVPALQLPNPALALLEGVGVAAVPGTAFSTDPADATVLRFCYAKDDAVLDEGCRRLRTLASGASPAAR